MRYLIFAILRPYSLTPYLRRALAFFPIFFVVVVVVVVVVVNVFIIVIVNVAVVNVADVLVLVDFFVVAGFKI